MCLDWHGCCAWTVDQTSLCPFGIRGEHRLRWKCAAVCRAIPPVLQFRSHGHAREPKPLWNRCGDEVASSESAECREISIHFPTRRAVDGNSTPVLCRWGIGASGPSADATKRRQSQKAGNAAIAGSGRSLVGQHEPRYFQSTVDGMARVARKSPAQGRLSNAHRSWALHPPRCADASRWGNNRTAPHRLRRSDRGARS